MDKLRDFFESTGKDVDPIISEISLMKQLIKERVHELLSNVVDKIFFGPTADALRGLFGSFHQPSLQSQIQ